MKAGNKLFGMSGLSLLAGFAVFNASGYGASFTATHPPGARSRVGAGGLEIQHH
jgi:hypothetical protein